MSNYELKCKMTVDQNYYDLWNALMFLLILIANACGFIIYIYKKFRQF